MKSQGEAKRRIPGTAFFQSIVSELKKVAWPSRQEATRITGIVLVVTVAISMVLWGIDTGFTELVKISLLD